jgi:hypothetical protein
VVLPLIIPERRIGVEAIDLTKPGFEWLGYSTVATVEQSNPNNGLGMFSVRKPLPRRKEELVVVDLVMTPATYPSRL